MLFRSSILAPDLGVVRADPTHIEQVLMNLCVNARDAMPDGGRLLIETHNAEIDEEYARSHTYARPGRYAVLDVTDTGLGMDAATQEHIFEPFFTTKEQGKGTGLGLATVYGIVKQHGGFLHVYSEPGHGTQFHVYLPLSDGAVENREEKRVAENSERVCGGHETILLAEDHEGVREVACDTLAGLGYQVLLAADGDEAVAMFSAHCNSIALAVLDVVMPGTSGPQAYARICATRPDLPVIFVTGYSAEAAEMTARAERGAVFLQKPYRPSQLGQRVREMLDRAAHSAGAIPPGGGGFVE